MSRDAGGETEDDIIAGYQDVPAPEPPKTSTDDCLPGFEQRSLGFDDRDPQAQHDPPTTRHSNDRKDSRMVEKKRGRPFKAASSGSGGPELQKEFEVKLATAAAEYRDRHYKGADAGRVRWNQEGAEGVLGIAKQAFREVPGLNKKALAEAAEVAYGTLNKWVENGDAGKTKQAATRLGATKTAKPVSAPPAATSQVTFDIIKLQSGGFRVSIDPNDIKTFLRSI